MHENEQTPPRKRFRVSEELKDTLRERTYDQLCDELALLEPKNVAEEALMEAYIEVMEEKCPPDDSGFDYDGALAKALKVLDSELEPTGGDEKEGKSGRGWDPWRIAQRTVAAVAIVAVVLGGSYVLGFDWPKYIVEFGRDQMVIRPTESGQMELTDVEVGEYRSLEEALAAYDLSGVVPTWIPEDYAIEDIVVEKQENRLNVIGIYGANRGAILIRVTVSPISDFPTGGYEWENKKSTEYSIGETVFNITTNYEQVRTTWVIGDAYCSISGTFTEQELKIMIHSIFEE